MDSRRTQRSKRNFGTGSRRRGRVTIEQLNFALKSTHSNASGHIAASENDIVPDKRRSGSVGFSGPAQVLRFMRLDWVVLFHCSILI